MYYDQCLQTEQKGFSTLISYFNLHSLERPRFITEPMRQKRYGDLECNFKNLGHNTVEVKVEQEFTGNLFIETWSNREWGNVGWIHTCHANILAYYFIDRDFLVGCDLQALRDWCFARNSPNIDRYREVAVRKDQANDARGVPIPIVDLKKANLNNWFQAHPQNALNQKGLLFPNESH